jgi:hypothetical protein
MPTATVIEEKKDKYRDRTRSIRSTWTYAERNAATPEQRRNMDSWAKSPRMVMPRVRKQCKNDCGGDTLPMPKASRK